MSSAVVSSSFSVQRDPNYPYLNYSSYPEAWVCSCSTWKLFKAGNLCYDKWKRVQHLASCFWNRWKMEYLSTLQGRRKWQWLIPNIQVGDLVLLKDQQAERIKWPMGLIVKSVPSDDGKVRMVEVKVSRQETVKTFIRPITELILLLPFGE